MSTKPEKTDLEDDLLVPDNGEATTDLGAPGANLGTHGGTGADSGGTGAGATALDSIGSQGNFDSGVADHLKIKHKIGPKK